MEKFKKTFLCLGALSLGCGNLLADDNIDYSFQNISSEQQENPGSPGQGENRPYKLSAMGDWIGKSDVRRHRHDRGSVKFYMADFQADASVYYNPDCEEGLGVSFGYTRSRFDWGDNTYFKTKDMDQLSFSVTGFSKRIHNWLCTGYVTATWEPRYTDFYEYTNYEMLFWGRYTCTDVFNMHIGFLAQTGMKIDNVWPVIGFDWLINDKWKLNAVFPMNMSLVYTVNEVWTAAAAIRIFDLRYRMGKHQNIKKGFEKGLLRYRNSGLEFVVNYVKDAISANVHVGGTFGGRFKIANRHYKRKQHFDLGSAAYAGAEASYKF